MEKTSRAKLIVKILAPVVIIIVVAAIWVFRNNEDSRIATSDNQDLALVSDSIDLEKLKSYNMPIMLDFGADECIPCKEMKPVLEEANAEYQDIAIVKFYDVWKYPQTAQGFPMTVIPTQFFFDANGAPYVPSDPEAMGMIMYQDQDTGEHLFTAHEGALTKEQVDFILAELGATK